MNWFLNIISPNKKRKSVINDDDYVWFFVQTVTGVDWLYFVIYEPYKLIYEPL